MNNQTTAAIKEVVDESWNRVMVISNDLIQSAIGLNTITPEQAKKLKDVSSRINDFFIPVDEEELDILAEEVSRRLRKRLKLKKR